MSRQPQKGQRNDPIIILLTSKSQQPARRSSPHLGVAAEEMDTEKPQKEGRPLPTAQALRNKIRLVALTGK